MADPLDEPSQVPAPAETAEAMPRAPKPTLFATAGAPSPAVDAIIRSRDFSLFYGRKAGVKNITMEIYPRRVTAIIGPSGCGKSTFLRSINRMNDLIPGVRTEGRRVLKYAIAALLVRLSQYVLFSASDTLGMVRTERERYLAERLTAGNIEISQSRQVLNSALKMVMAALEQQGVSAPIRWDTDRLLAPPSYSRPFVDLVDRVMADAHRAKLLPLTLELRLFGYSGNDQPGGGLIRRTRLAAELTALVIGFVAQSLGVPVVLLSGPAQEEDGVRVVEASGGRGGQEPGLLGPGDQTGGG